MIERKKLSSMERQQKLIDKIEKAKNELARLKNDRLIECGELLAKYGLEQVDDTILDQSFQKLAKELTNGNCKKDKKEETTAS